MSEFTKTVVIYKCRRLQSIIRLNKYISHLQHRILWSTVELWKCLKRGGASQTKNNAWIRDDDEVRLYDYCRGEMRASIRRFSWVILEENYNRTDFLHYKKKIKILTLVVINVILFSYVFAIANIVLVICRFPICGQVL